jgi:hypothetical protein
VCFWKGTSLFSAIKLCSQFGFSHRTAKPKFLDHPTFNTVHIWPFSVFVVWFRWHGRHVVSGPHVYSFFPISPLSSLSPYTGSRTARGWGWVVTPRFSINPNSRSKQLTVVKSRSTWALTSKNSLTYPSDPHWLVNTLVGPTHGQRLGQTPLPP